MCRGRSVVVIGMCACVLIDSNNVTVLCANSFLLCCVIIHLHRTVDSITILHQFSPTCASFRCIAKDYAVTFGAYFLLNDDEKTHFYTVLPSYAVFQKLFTLLETCATKEIIPKCSLINKFFLTLTKLRLGLLHKDISCMPNEFNRTFGIQNIS